MNILYICGYSANYKGNFIESLTHLDSALHGVQKACYIFPPEAQGKSWIEELRQAGASVYFNTNSVLGEWKLQKRICEEHEIDVIYHHFWNLKDCLANRILKLRHRKIKMVIHHHNEYHISDSKVNECIKHWILDADMHIGCGKLVAEEVEKAGFRNVKWIDNCIEFSRLDQWEPYPVPSGVNLLTFSSYSYDVKGIDISIKAVFAVRKHGIPANLLIAVAANPEEIRRRVREECNALGSDIPDCIQLLPARPDLATYYHAVDAYLNSSRSEGFCYATIEAVYCGAQVIQTDILGNRLDVPETLVYEVGNVAQLEDRIIQLYEAIQNPTPAVKERQKKYVLEKYGIDTWVSQEVEALNSLF